MITNNVQLIGNVGNDPEVRSLDNGSSVATFSIATNETYKNKQGEKVTDTQWHNLTCWRGLADVVKNYVKKGDLIAVSGKITYRSYEDKDGIKRNVTDIVVSDLKMLGGKVQQHKGSKVNEDNSDVPW